MVDKYGKIDVLVNNAAIQVGGWGRLQGAWHVAELLIPADLLLLQQQLAAQP